MDIQFNLIFVYVLLDSLNFPNLVLIRAQRDIMLTITQEHVKLVKMVVKYVILLMYVLNVMTLIIKFPNQEEHANVIQTQLLYQMVLVLQILKFFIVHQINIINHQEIVNLILAQILIMMDKLQVYVFLAN